jgi:hypothetical protein
MRYALLLLALLCGPATAATGDDRAKVDPAKIDQAAVNAVDAAWSRYTRLAAKDDGASAELIAESTAQHYAFLRDVALYGSTEQVRRLPVADRLTVYGLRAKYEAPALAGWDGRAAYRHCVQDKLCHVVMRHADGNFPSLSHVAMIDADRALGEVQPPTGERYVFGPEFVREDGRWKTRPERQTEELSSFMAAAAAQAGGETALLQHLLGDFLGDGQAPSTLSALELAPRDDEAQRNRLNERWPDYQAYIDTQVAAIERKAEAGEALAQHLYGRLLYTGLESRRIAADRDAALAVLERASDSGHADSALAVANILLSTNDRLSLSPQTLRRALPHLRRSAESGNPQAMMGYADFIRSGAAGLTSDCTQAVEWLRKAEDAGMAQARNDRVWILATCPIAGQRDARQSLALGQHMIARRAQLSAAELDTVAAALAANGEFAQAVAFQSDALARLKDGELDPRSRERMQGRLALYRQGRDYTETEPLYAKEP